MICAVNFAWAIMASNTVTRQVCKLYPLITLRGAPQTPHPTNRTLVTFLRARSLTFGAVCYTAICCGRRLNMHSWRNQCTVPCWYTRLPSGLLQATRGVHRRNTLISLTAGTSTTLRSTWSFNFQRRKHIRCFCCDCIRTVLHICINFIRIVSWKSLHFNCNCTATTWQNHQTFFPVDFWIALLQKRHT